MSRRDVIRSALAHVIATQGEEWTYRRGSASGTVTIVLSRAAYEQDDGDGPVAELRTRYDGLTMAADLALIEATEPQPGDRLSDGTTTVEVVGDESRPCFDYVGPYRDCLRLHCQLVASG